MCYVVDSWIEYVAVRKGVARRETKVSGHYIAYKFIEGTLYHFDDAVVNSTQMLSEYETNLIFYQRADIPHMHGTPILASLHTKCQNFTDINRTL